MRGTVVPDFLAQLSKGKGVQGLSAHVVNFRRKSDNSYPLPLFQFLEWDNHTVCEFDGVAISGIFLRLLTEKHHFRGRNSIGKLKCRRYSRQYQFGSIGDADCALHGWLDKVFCQKHKEV